MLDREQLKNEIDRVSEQNLETLYQIILLFQKLNPAELSDSTVRSVENPLKNSITFENDLISPIDIS